MGNPSFDTEGWLMKPRALEVLSAPKRAEVFSRLVIERTLFSGGSLAVFARSMFRK